MESRKAFNDMIHINKQNRMEASYHGYCTAIFKARTRMIKVNNQIQKKTSV